MLRTETEARNNLCPNSMNSADKEASCCAGSMCMAWRWSNMQIGHKRSSHASGEAGYRTHEEFMAAYPLKGWCGLAPEPKAVML